MKNVLYECLKEKINKEKIHNKRLIHWKGLLIEFALLSTGPLVHKHITYARTGVQVKRIFPTIEINKVRGRKTYENRLRLVNDNLFEIFERFGFSFYQKKILQRFFFFFLSSNLFDKKKTFLFIYLDPSLYRNFDVVFLFVYTIIILVYRASGRGVLFVRKFFMN